MAENRPTEQRLLTLAEDLGLNEKGNVHTYKASRVDNEGKSYVNIYRFSDECDGWNDLSVGDVIDAAVSKSEFKGKTYLWVQKYTKASSGSDAAVSVGATGKDKDRLIVNQTAGKISGMLNHGSGNVEKLILDAADIADALFDLTMARATILASKVLDATPVDENDDISF